MMASLLVCIAIITFTSSAQDTKWPLPSDRYTLNEINKKHMQPPKTPAATLPNFLIFFVDDMGYGDVGFTGHPSISTPNIDKLAADGMILTSWYTGQPVCSPSRAAMLTGRFPVRSGCAGGWSGGIFGNAAIGGLPPNETTFAAVLKQAGYATKMMGKWHVGQREQFQPQNHGFDSAFWIPVSVDMGSSAWLPNDKALPLPLLDGSTVLQQPVDLSTVSDLYVQHATDFIHTQAAAQTPFVLYMAHSHVHVPDFTNTKSCNSSIGGRYGDAVQEVDNVIGSIYAAVVNAGVADNTLTFWTTDNGPWLQKNLAQGTGGLFYMGKFTTWEGGMRQPAFAHWPGHIPPGSRSAEIVSTMDIFMTMINMTGSMKYLPDDDRIYDGKDMSDIIFNENGGKSQYDCYPMYGGAINASNCPYIHNASDPRFEACSGIWAIRCKVPNYDGSYKAHWVTRFTNGTVSVQMPPLLYNIEWDPSERHPIKTSNANYKIILNYLSAKRKAALATVKNVTNQMLLGQNAAFEICAAPNSQELYPQYPNCTLTTQGFTGFVCEPVCYDQDNCPGGEPVGPDTGPLPFASMASQGPVLHSNDDAFNDVGVTVEINYNNN